MNSEMVEILGKLLDEKLTEKFDSIQKDIDKLAKAQDEIKELIKDI